MANPTPYPPSVLVSMLTSEHPRPQDLRMLERELALRTELDSAWAVRPLALAQHQGRSALILEDQQGEPLDQLVQRSPISPALGARTSAEPAIELGLFLRLAVSLAAALGGVHRRGIIHKDIKPANVIVNSATGQIWLTGFGVASRLLRERQSPEPPQFVAGTLAYMAPEQTGRMNRSIDARSDLYALGVTFYEMLTGSLPFIAADPMEWVHCHIARQAEPPSERVKHVPPPVSEIIMKLLAKTAEERYQTATGLERDLRRCLAQFEAEGRIDDFALGERDTPDRLLIPEKLYGRGREIEVLVAAFDRVVEGGGPELVLVSGYSGIGKSAVVNELHKVLVPRRGLFAAGKFDQYKRDVPYSTLAQAFQSLVRSLLAKSDTELGEWGETLREALGPNGQLMVDLVPELKLIVGEQASVPELPPQDAQRRFQLVLRRFLAVFARPEHPLVLFLDDLQWLDAATLDLTEDLLTQTDVRCLLLVGAYRDNEVTPTHPLMRTLKAISSVDARVHEIVLASLAREDLNHLLADSLCCEIEHVAPLAELVHERTAGNPFFVIQFLSVLVEEGLLAFDHAAGRWCWNMPRIHAKEYTDNVVDFMVQKLGRLPAETQDILQHLSCLGSSAAVALLEMTYDVSKEDLHGGMYEALRSGLVLVSGEAYRFLHDRVQEAAYSLIPEMQRAVTHLRIGRLLLANTSAVQREEAIFEIVNHLNRGASLITSQEEREQLAELNLIAGKRAKGAAAWGSALTYLIAGIALVPEEGWERRHDLLFELELYRAECEFLTGEMTSAEEHLRMISSRAADMVQRAAVACLLADLYFAFQQPDRAVAECLECLRHAGLDIPMQATEVQAQAAYDRVCSRLDGLGIDELAVRPLMTDSTSRSILDVLAKITPSALVMHKYLVTLIVCAAVDISLERGHCDSSCFAYAFLGFIASWKFGDFEAGFRFGRLGYELVERKDLRKFEGYVGLHLSGPIMPWARHIATCRELIRTTFAVANKTGDRLSAAASRNELVNNLLFAGEPLIEVEKEAEVGLEFCRRAAFSAFIDRANIVAAFVRNLRGLTRLFGSFDDERFDEHLIETHFESQPHLLACEFWYWARRLQARFFAGDYPAALNASIRAQRLRSESPGALELVEHELYSALTRAAVCDSASPDEKQRHLYAVAAHLQQLEAWARHCPENFENCAALVAAEIARVEGRDPDAMRLYEQAILSARENGFVHNEALALELAARFYAARGFDRIARSYLRDARYGYLQWGAHGKVRQLDELYPHLGTEQAAPASTGTIGAFVEQLELSTIMKVSQAVSGEMALEKLLDTVMRTALEQAGAERAVLILSREAGQRIVAEAATGNDGIIVQLRDEPVSGFILPETIFRYVLHTQESVILDDAAVFNPFSTDPYIAQRHARSVLCLPLTNQAKLIGVLYLENNLTPHVFSPARTAVLKLLASQAAISLENTRLYRDLAEREARIRRLVDANIIGIVISDVEGRILEANDAFLRMVGYDRDDLVSQRVRWTDMTPPEWRDRDQHLVQELKRTGSLQPFEKEFFRKDGSRVPVLIGVANFEDAGDEGVAFVLDLTERKRAQEALNRAGAELAHVSRVTALSALTASIAHEVNQPLSGIITNAGTCVRMLDATPPNIDGARETARRTIRDGNRASEVIARLRALFSKAEVPPESLDLNEAAREVIALSSNDLRRHRVLLKSELADDLPSVIGDRIQLQQVVLNLLRNAADAMVDVDDRQRQLLIKTDREGSGRVRLSVRDAGVGLSPQTLDSLFDPFYTTKSGGMGIGLFVSRSIVERHHGRLWAEPNQNEPGATFAFSIPIVQRA